MEFSGYIKKLDYSFGDIYCFKNYVISDINDPAEINTVSVKKMFTEIHEFYKTQKIVYISNRPLFRNIEPEIYKLINPKKLIGIAIVGQGQKLRDQASLEQTLYSGSFSFFESMNSAISWAESFVKSSKDR